MGLPVCILVERPLEKHLLFRSLPLSQIVLPFLTREMGALFYKMNWAKEGESFSLPV